MPVYKALMTCSLEDSVRTWMKCVERLLDGRLNVSIMENRGRRRPDRLIHAQRDVVINQKHFALNVLNWCLTKRLAYS